MNERDDQRAAVMAPASPASSPRHESALARPTQPRPSTRVIIVNWKQPELTIRACRSIAPQLGQGDRLVVVDNASGDGSAQQIREAGFEVIEAPRNEGFAAGVNRGALGLTEETLTLLNNDAVAQPGYLDALLAPLAVPARPEHQARQTTYAEPSPHIGATTALLLLSGRWRPARPGEVAETGLDGQRWTRVDGAAEAPGGGQVLVNSTGNLVDATGNGYDRDWLTPLSRLQAQSEVFGICGGACAISAPAWHELGGLREDLFMYYEDTDFSYRLRKAGYSVRFVEDAVALHEHAASSGTQSNLFIRVNARNRILVAAEHAPRSVFARALARTSVRALKELLSQRRRGPVTHGLFEALGRMARRRPSR